MPISRLTEKTRGSILQEDWFMKRILGLVLAMVLLAGWAGAFAEEMKAPDFTIPIELALPPLEQILPSAI